MTHEEAQEIRQGLTSSELILQSKVLTGIRGVLNNPAYTPYVHAFIYAFNFRVNNGERMREQAEDMSGAFSQALELVLPILDDPDDIAAREQSTEEIRQNPNFNLPVDPSMMTKLVDATTKACTDPFTLQHFSYRMETHGLPVEQLPEDQLEMHLANALLQYYAQREIGLWLI